ncbi:MAG: folate-binding protein [Gammaproteobacteria bacterium]
MTSQLHDQMLNAGARISDGVIRDFGSPAEELAAAMHGNIVSPLSLAAMHVAGDDAAALLGGQLTADIKALSGTQSCIAAWCTPQGRALTIVRVLRHGDGFLLLLPSELAEVTIKRLRMYVLRAKVTIEDASVNFACLGVSGQNALAALAADLPLQTTAGARVSLDDLAIIRLPDARPRLLLVGPPSALANLWSRMTTVARAAGAAAWDWLDITAALPQIFASTRERFVPLALNLDALGGISFNKGCYTGQEIIARMKYRGQLKQRMHIGRIENANVPAPGTRLAVRDAEMSAGEIVQSTVDTGGGTIFTATVLTELVGTDRVHVESATGPRIQWLPLPYQLGQPE